MFNLLWYRIQSGCTSMPMISPDHLPDPLHLLYLAQEKIGWDQLLYGRIQCCGFITSQKWAMAQSMELYFTPILYDSYYSFSMVQGMLRIKTFMTLTTSKNVLLWNNILQLWYTMLKATLLQLLASHLSMENIMTRSTRQLRTYATQMAQQIKVHLKFSHQRAVLHMYDIYRFFKKCDPYDPANYKPPIVGDEWIACVGL